jgi:hypothetical protein
VAPLAYQHERAFTGPHHESFSTGTFQGRAQ